MTKQAMTDSVDSPQPTFGRGKPNLVIVDRFEDLSDEAKEMFEERDEVSPRLAAGRSAEIDFVSDPDIDDDETVPPHFNEDAGEVDEDEDEDDFEDEDDEDEDDE